MNRKFRKIAIANRGEIALRIIRTAKALQIKTVVFFSVEEKDAPHVLQADEAYSLGDGELKNTYLNIEKIVRLAIESGAEAVHPGYGFLSENPDFAKACELAGLVFIGPSVQVLQQMGNKVTAKNIAKKVGVKVLESLVVKPSEVINIHATFTFPLLVKASNGGGGKGMQVVYNADELQEKAKLAARAALNYFGNDEIYVENYLEDARHIEVQILGDAYGNVVHLFERDCTLQRNHQKIVEEAPAISISKQLREKLHEAALAICREVAYQNAGTVEFLVDSFENFYFIEMNPRIQVEHPVTEAVTGIDIVREQLSIAAGNPLSFLQTDVKIKGHAIEVRLYSEDPHNEFLPSGKPLLHFNLPWGENIRVESGIGTKGAASLFDPLLCKVIAWGENREIARLNLTAALSQTSFFGSKTNLHYIKTLLGSVEYIGNKFNTRFCHTGLEKLIAEMNHETQSVKKEYLLAAALWNWFSKPVNNVAFWQKTGYWRAFLFIEIIIDEESFNIHFHIEKNKVEFDFKEYRYSFLVKNSSLQENQIELEQNGQVKWVSFFNINGASILLNIDGVAFQLTNGHHLDAYPEDFSTEIVFQNGNNEVVESHLFGRVVEIPVKVEQTINKGDVLMIIESMKSENRVLATCNATIKKINVKVGEQVTDKMPLIYLENI
ncbi:MAG TPA: biotin carboxylase N-terminal domain-containing protein [Prolixibacteraceae bacterium]|nr:biotin carboxylase N-terminal domain-containing protein [Prolixibacteraceae bacterium]